MEPLGPPPASSPAMVEETSGSARFELLGKADLPQNIDAEISDYMHDYQCRSDHTGKH